MPIKAPPNSDLRAATENDVPFMQALYASTRKDEEPLCHWPKAHREKFLSLQFEAQREDYARTYPNANHLIVISDAKPVGRLLLNETAADIRVVDISLIESFRRKGIGRGLLQSLQAEAEEKNLSVSLHVLRESPALRLYQRLGFKERPSASPGRLFLVWEPPVRKASTPS